MYHEKLLRQMDMELRLKQVVHDKAHEALRAEMVEKYGEEGVRKEERVIKELKEKWYGNE